MSLRIEHISLHRTDLQTRLPFKYGIATMTQAPHVFLHVVIRNDGRRSSGISADHLPPKWFTKSPETPLVDEIDEMLHVICHAADNATGRSAVNAFELWRDLSEQQAEWAAAEHLPPLLAQFGTSLVERAVIEACCRDRELTITEAIRSNALGIRLGRIHPELQGSAPADWLPAAPRRQITARHTVGLADPLRLQDIPDSERLHDGLPQALDECLEHYGLRQLKIKLSGHPEQDVPRLQQIRTVCQAHPQITFSVDGNEQFTSFAAFRDYWQVMQETPELAKFWRRLLFVEQPFHRSVALDADTLAGFREWAAAPPVIIDESDAEIDSLRKALALGYQGSSHKNCKGVFKSVANACLIQWRRRTTPEVPSVFSGEDLANIGPIALLQDLATAATLGIESVERNGHHYFAGLSAFSDEVQNRVLTAHSDLYRRSPSGWPTLRLESGRLALDSINAAPFGVGFRLPLDEFPCVARYA